MYLSIKIQNSKCVCVSVLAAGATLDLAQEYGRAVSGFFLGVDGRGGGSSAVRSSGGALAGSVCLARQGFTTKKPERVGF